MSMPLLTVSDHTAVIDIGTDLVNIFQSLFQLIFCNTVLQKGHMMSQIMTIDGRLLLRSG